jgi:MoaA/NifB/PqqE/SkfB family radical SAM enzyme
MAIDLSKEVTVFVITIGDINYNDCIKALESQSCSFTLDIIKDYYPMSKAFQEMLNRVQTPYYIQVDEDMILRPNAVLEMYNFITNSSSIMDCYQLYDVHLDMLIYGVKIYRTDDFKRYPYNLNHPSCEVEQLDRMKADGLQYRLKEVVMGEHSPKWTDESIFERYYNLMQKFKIFKYEWMGRLPKQLMEKFQREPTQNNFFAIAGMLSGIYEKDTMTEEKDGRRKRQDLSRLQSFFVKPTHATVYITDKCNFKCEWCPREHAELEKFEDTTASQVDAFLYQFPSISGVCICGFGEPLLSKELVRVVHTIKAHKKFCGLITNGSLLKYRLKDFFDMQKPDYISVSLNAHCKEEHERITKTKTWDDVLEGIRECVAYGPTTYISSVVTTDNLKYVPEVIKLAYNLKVKGLYLHNLLPHFDDKLNGKTFWELVLQTEHQSFIDEWKQLPESSIVLRYPVLIDKSGGRNICKYPWNSIAINGNGSISICNSVLPAQASNGHFMDIAVLQNEYCTQFRDKFTNRDKSLPCDKCFRNWKFE